MEAGGTRGESISAGRLFRGPTDDSLQRGHQRRDRSNATPGRTVTKSARRETTRTSDVGGLRFGSDSKGTVDSAGSQSVAGHDPGDAAWFSRQKGAGGGSHRLRNRSRP